MYFVTTRNSHAKLTRAVCCWFKRVDNHSCFGAKLRNFGAASVEDYLYQRRPEAICRFYCRQFGEHCCLRVSTTLVLHSGRCCRWARGILELRALDFVTLMRSSQLGWSGFDELHIAFFRMWLHRSEQRFNTVCHQICWPISFQIFDSHVLRAKRSQPYLHRASLKDI